MAQDLIIEPNQLKSVSTYVDYVVKASNGDLIVATGDLNAAASLDPVSLLCSDILPDRIDEIIKNVDRYYSWHNYTDVISLAFLQGTFWNALAPVKPQTVDPSTLQEFLRWLLTEGGIYHQEHAHHHDPDKILQDMLHDLEECYGFSLFDTQWKHFSINCDVLYGSDDGVEVSSGKLAYFEIEGDNIFLLSFTPTKYIIFLLNSYPGYSNPHALLQNAQQHADWKVRQT